jgi:hypothetical protein
LAAGINVEQEVGRAQIRRIGVALWIVIGRPALVRCKWQGRAIGSVVKF